MIYANFCNKIGLCLLKTQRTPLMKMTNPYFINKKFLLILELVFFQGHAHGEIGGNAVCDT